MHDTSCVTKNCMIQTSKGNVTSALPGKFEDPGQFEHPEHLDQPREALVTLLLLGLGVIRHTHDGGHRGGVLVPGGRGGGASLQNLGISCKKYQEILCRLNIYIELLLCHEELYEEGEDGEHVHDVHPVLEELALGGGAQQPDDVLQGEPRDADGLYHLQEGVRQQHTLVVHHLEDGKHET